MRKSLDKSIERGRVRSGPYGSDSSFGMTGAFIVEAPSGAMLRIVSSDGDETIRFEHVSVSTQVRCPSWEEMTFVKRAFWREDECVMQLHPPKAEYVNHHPFTLHLWKPLDAEIPRPPMIAVGPPSGS